MGVCNGGPRRTHGRSWALTMPGSRVGDRGRRPAFGPDFIHELGIGLRGKSPKKKAASLKLEGSHFRPGNLKTGTGKAWKCREIRCQKDPNFQKFHGPTFAGSVPTILPRFSEAPPRGAGGGRLSGAGLAPPKSALPSVPVGDEKVSDSGASLLPRYSPRRPPPSLPPSHDYS